MTLEQFISKQKDLLDKFSVHYGTEKAKGLENWPDEMPYPDWAEQLLFFEEEQC